jgi:hypothetical protein
MGRARTTTASILTMTTVALGVLVASGTAASAASPSACTMPSWSNKDARTGTVIAPSGVASMHNGPNSDCPILDTMFAGDKLYYHCYVYNSAGNTWTHLRLGGTQIQGWVWDEYLTDRGSDNLC